MDKETKILRKALKKQWKEHQKITFPKRPRYEPLDDLHPELALMDGHVAGIVDSFLSGIKVDRKLIYIDEEYNKRLEAIRPTTPDTNAEWLIFKNYKEKLDKMVNLVLALYDRV